MHAWYASVDPLRLALLRLCTGELPAEELPDLAADALVRGIDVPALRELAGAPPTEYDDNRGAACRSDARAGSGGPNG